MEMKVLKEHEGKTVKIILKNNFLYTGIVYEITSDGLIKFEERSGETVTVEAEFIALISEWKNGVKF